MTKQTKPIVSAIQVIDRMAQLLDAIADSSDDDSPVPSTGRGGRVAGPSSLKVLSAECGLHPSTAHRILGTLVLHGLVERSEAGHYRLGVKLLKLASRVRERVDLRREALPVMEWLRDKLGETVNLTLREGDEVVYVERVASQQTIRVEQVIGSRAPLHVTAVGKLFLAYDGQVACRDYARRTRLPRYTPNTLTDVARLWKAAALARKQGYSLDNEEAETGVGCIAVPVLDGSHKMVAGLSISALRQRRRDEWIPLVVEAGKMLSARLGHHPG